MSTDKLLPPLLVAALGVCNANAQNVENRAAEEVVKDRPQPDIIFILADDWGAGDAGAYGNTVIKTPNFDRVAREGILFNNAYSAAPSSAASRLSILTGRYPHSMGPGANLWTYLPTPDEISVYPSILEEHGYVVVQGGKGWAPGNFVASGWDHNPAGHKVDDVVDVILNTPLDKPVCVWSGNRNPHRPYRDGEGREKGIDPDRITTPGIYPDEYMVRSDIADYYYRSQLVDNKVGQILSALKKTGRIENALIVVTSDNGAPFPRAKATLNREGVSVPMAIMWKGVIEPSVCDDFVSLASLAPTFLEVAGVTDFPEMHVGSLVPIFKGQSDPKKNDIVFVDRERHATEARADNSGYPSRAAITKDYIYIRNYFPDRWFAGDPKDEEPSKIFGPHGPYAEYDNGPAKYFMLTHKDEYPVQYKAAFDKKPYEELYDLRKDPNQFNNVAGDRKYKKILKMMRARLEQWQKDTDDPRLAEPQTDCFDSYPYIPQEERNMPKPVK